jgi:hypothetical protein
MNIKNVLIGSSLFIVYNICCIQYIRHNRMEKEKNYKLKFEIKDIKL